MQSGISSHLTKRSVLTSAQEETFFALMKNFKGPGSFNAIEDVKFKELMKLISPDYTYKAPFWSGLKIATASLFSGAGLVEAANLWRGASKPTVAAAPAQAYTPNSNPNAATTNSNLNSATSNSNFKAAA